MPLPWKKSKSGRISKFVSDIQQTPKHGGSLVVETGFPTSLIDLFFKNRDRLKKTSSKRNIKAESQSVSNRYNPSPRRLSSFPPPLPLQRPRSLPQRLDDLAFVTDYPSVTKIEETLVVGLTKGNRHDGEEKHGGSGAYHGGGGGCVLMVVVFKVFLVAVLALSTKKLAVGVTISAFALLFLELAVARVFTLFKLCPSAQVRLDSLIGKLIGRRRQEKPEELSATHDGRNKPTFEIVEESSDETRVPQSENKTSDWEDSLATLDKAKPEVEDKQVQTIRDVMSKTERSKSSRLKSRIVNKIVPKKLRSYKKNKKMKIKEGQEAVDVVEEEGEGSVTSVSSLVSDDIIESEVSDRDDVDSNPPLLESCQDHIQEEVGSKGDLKIAIVLILIALVGLLSGKVLAIVLTLSWCLILKVFCCKSQASL